MSAGVVVSGSVGRCKACYVHSQVYVMCDVAAWENWRAASVAVSCDITVGAWRVSPTVGNCSEIMLNAVQLSPLRNSLSESLVTYTICRVSRV